MNAVKKSFHQAESRVYWAAGARYTALIDFGDTMSDFWIPIFFHTSLLQGSWEDQW